MKTRTKLISAIVLFGGIVVIAVSQILIQSDGTIIVHDPNGGGRYTLQYGGLDVNGGDWGTGRGWFQCKGFATRDMVAGGNLQAYSNLTVDGHLPYAKGRVI